MKDYRSLKLLLLSFENDFLGESELHIAVEADWGHNIKLVSCTKFSREISAQSVLKAVFEALDLKVCNIYDTSIVQIFEYYSL